MKRVTGILCALFLSLCMCQTAFAAYYCTEPGAEGNQLAEGVFTEDERGRRFTGSDGQVYVNHWLYAAKTRAWYYFDGDGYAVTGMQNIGGKPRYFNKFGQLQNRFFVYDGNLYCGDSDTGEVLTSLNGGNDHKRGREGVYYTFDEFGRAHSADGNYDPTTLKEINPAWKKEGKNWTYTENGRKLANTWHEDNGYRFYFDKDGNMVKSTVLELGGQNYKFSATGAMQTRGGATIDGKPYIVGEGGTLVPKPEKEEPYIKNDYALNERQQELNEKANPFNSNQTVQWFNATYAVLTRGNGQNIRAYGGELKLAMLSDSYAELDEMVSRDLRELLVSYWGVTDRASAERVLNGLVASGNLTGSAWDYSRAMSNLGYYYLAGYYTLNEALDQSLEIAKVIQTKFTSWDDFMNSYFVGYDRWSGTAGERRDIYEGLKSSAFNPYAIDWNLKLEKSW